MGFFRRQTTAPVQQLHALLNEDATKRIARRVREAELQTSAEIMVRLAAASGEGEVRAIAEAEFIRLGLGALDLQNGVLFYVALDRRAVEVVVGQKCAEKIPVEIWQQAANAIADGFREERPSDGIIAAVDVVAPALAEMFPPGASDTVNLPDVMEDQ